ncbi:hypothetical protein Tco_0414174 [Tanacetum coccineum]
MLKYLMAVLFMESTDLKIEGDVETLYTKHDEIIAPVVGLYQFVHRGNATYDGSKEKKMGCLRLWMQIEKTGNSADGSITRFCSVLQLAVRSPSLSLLDGKMRIVKAFPPREVQTSPERN